MKRLSCLILILFSFSVHAQLLEDFSDGNFTVNPVWGGDAALFIVNSQLQLQSNNTVADDTFYLSTASTAAIDVQWEAYIKLDFSTSSNNYVDMYLISNNADLTAGLQGYFVRIGNTSDEISLYRKDGLVITKIIDGIDGRSQPASSNNNLKVKVTRSLTGDWTLFDDITGSGNNYVFEGSVNDMTYQVSSYLGISIRQSTSSFFNRHYFDNLYIGPIVVDVTPPLLISATALSSSTLDVKFNEILDLNSAQNTLNYSVSNNILNPLTAVLDATDRSLVHLSFAGSFTPGNIYTLTVNNVADFNNNTIAANSTIQFGLPDSAGSNDIVINEILFNPYTGGVDFVELYNRSSKALDLNNLRIANLDEITWQLDVVSEITPSAYILLPGSYVVLTEEPSYIRSTYNSAGLASFIDIVDLPSYNDDAGGVVLLDKINREIDRFIYKDSYQYPLLNDKNGVSLERISPERPSADISNWHSAAASVGFATPGLKNSQFSLSQSDGSEITVDPDIFSPDNDGYNDVLSIHYKFDQPGYTATVKIFTSTGRPVIDLIRSELLGTEEGVWSWDGINKDNEKAPVGIYVLYIEAFSAKGDTKKIKKTCVLGAKL